MMIYGDLQNISWGFANCAALKQNTVTIQVISWGESEWDWMIVYEDLHNISWNSQIELRWNRSNRMMVYGDLH